MWIRSQDKKRLIKPDYIRINGDDIEAIGFDMLCTKLGKYSSEEKTLKILDMIQKSISSHENFVFQMPLDSEVEKDDK